MPVYLERISLGDRSIVVAQVPSMPTSTPISNSDIIHHQSPATGQSTAVKHGWVYGLLFGLHFTAVGFAWIPLFTKLRELFGQQTAAICGSGPSIAAIMTLFLFLFVESRWPRIPRRLWCAMAEVGMACGYIAVFLAIRIPTAWYETQTFGVVWVFLPMFIAMGLCQASANALLTSMILASGHSANLPKYRAIGSLGYALVAFSMNSLIQPSHGLLLATITACIAALACRYLPNIEATKPTAANTETLLHSGRWNRQLPVIIPLLIMLFLIGNCEQFHMLYAHQFATKQFGTSGTNWIGYAVLLEICVLFLYPAKIHGWRSLLILVQPVAWILVFYSCTYGIEWSHWFAYAILLQGFNCAGVVMVQQRIGKILSNVSAQASIIFAQGLGSLSASSLDAFVLGEGTSVVWRTALLFSVAAAVVAIVTLTSQLKMLRHRH